MVVLVMLRNAIELEKRGDAQMKRVDAWPSFPFVGFFHFLSNRGFALRFSEWVWFGFQRVTTDDLLSMESLFGPLVLGHGFWLDLILRSI